MAGPPDARRRRGREHQRRLSRQARRERDLHVRRAVCQAALQLVRRAPFTDVTVDQITSGAGLSRSSFYLHFRDKYDVLRAMTEEIADDLYREADRWWHGEGDPTALVQDALEGVVSIYAENAAPLATVAEVSMYDEGFREFWGGLVGRFVSATADHLRREREAGRSTVRDADATADLLVWMTERCLYVHIARGTWSQRQAVEALTGVWTATVYSRTD